MKKLPHMTKPCANCPFRRDCLKGWLGAEGAKKHSSSRNFLCHKDTTKQCAGHMLMNGEKGNDFMQIANRLKISLKLSGRELLFDSQEEMIRHHSQEEE